MPFHVHEKNPPLEGQFATMSELSVDVKKIIRKYSFVIVLCA
ncbi:hypothetical protein PU02_0444 [Bartonella ancashensis]|uniref:Uncharacterized protein n=1 Tax=Bartonella ancashensis TaxID=1318743 RepID=A0A0M4L6H5_9HYPH|nr:hypothetical protein PU02_0444 [Bartonella ancashensis]